MSGKWREIREKGYIIPWKMFRIFMRTLPAMLKALIKHPIILIKANRAAKKYLKNRKMPGPPYEIPEYREGMPYNKSNERYLRPTHLCESNAPEIIALANELGAFKKSDREYAESVFEFVKNNIKLSFVGLDGAVATLKRGSGTCLHQLS
ncbi:MAG TPA: transglutaminase family protein, partial [Thermoplasmatales archaeon]|nr:transglutaminase family protein [Thermoplasmatales archaeon]